MALVLVIVLGSFIIIFLTKLYGVYTSVSTVIAFIIGAVIGIAIGLAIGYIRGKAKID
ncbi:MAG: hypothetical protein IJU02_09080 [Lachnospiraceae bacterium]|nr:hypothetical protein [Lachnospiraceae bacterium]